MGYRDFFGWRPYVPVAERRRKAEREMQKLKKKGYPVSPVVIEGTGITKTFWGKAWSENLERYSDYANRLPRGRTYVRNGSVVDLQIAPGEVSAMVSGSEIYRVAVKVAALPSPRWAAICTDCAGAIDSLVELLQGRFSRGVMERICQPRTGLFPAPAEIEFSCSCPDWASMCKHVAAVLYGIGARLDQRPELLFRLRKVDETDLIASAGKGLPLSEKGPAEERVLVTDGLAELFGLELGESGQGETPEARGKASAKPPRPAAGPRRAAKPLPAPRAAAKGSRSGGKDRLAAGTPAVPRPGARAVPPAPAKTKATAKARGQAVSAGAAKGSASGRSRGAAKPASRAGSGAASSGATKRASAARSGTSAARRGAKKPGASAKVTAATKAPGRRRA